MNDKRLIYTKRILSIVVLLLLSGCAEGNRSDSNAAKSSSDNRLLSSWCKVEAYGEIVPLKNSLTKLGLIVANSVTDSISGVLPVKCDKARKELDVSLDKSFDITFTDIPMLSGVISINSEIAKQTLDSANKSIEDLKKLLKQFPTARLYASNNHLSFEIITKYPVFDNKGEFIDDDKITILIRDISILLAEAVNGNLTSVEVKSNI